MARGLMRPARIIGLAMAAAACTAATQTAAASGQELELSIADERPGTSALGAGFRLTGSPYADVGGELDLVPLYLYEGKRAFAHGASAGVHLLRNGRFDVDVIARYRFWELDPAQGARHEGLARRRQTLEAGLAAGASGRWGELRAEWLRDLLDRHDGQELAVTYRRRFDRGRWSVSPYLSLSWLDARLTGYYFGVSEEEATEGRAAYAPGRVFNLGYGLNAWYRLTERAELFINFGVVELDGSIFDSPLIDEAVLPTTFIGGSYAFGSLHEPVVRTPRESRWSWRVNYGYQAEGNIVGEIDQGDFRRSVDADTRIAGLTLSRLINGGPHFDIYGRFALHRHFEGTAQRNFFSLAAYVMAVGKGYFPWSEEPSFRWGFGMGLSYAQRVPIVEQIKQTRRGRNTTRFLNYLEMTLDFPVARRRDAKSFGECYAGLTVVHRSGIFASADILGGVSGASDWITAHLECFR